jgi:hypothetical protein
MTPVFMKQAHAAGLTEGTKLVFPAAGFQHTLMKKEFTPEGMLFGHNTLYFANPNASPVAKEFVAWYAKTYNDYPEWEADRAYFALASYKAAVEAAAKAKNGSWPAQDDVIDALTGLSIESLGGKSSWRKDHIADQTFVQGFTTHNNPYDFVTLGSFESMYSTDLQKPPANSGNGSRPPIQGVTATRRVSDAAPLCYVTQRERLAPPLKGRSATDSGSQVGSTLGRGDQQIRAPAGTHRQHLPRVGQEFASPRGGINVA